MHQKQRPLLPPWLLYALTAAVCWGVWGVLSKGPSRELSGWMTQILFTFALIPSVIVAGLSKNVRTGTNKPLGLFWGFVSGLIAAAGNIFYYLALESGADTAIAVPLTNVYPLVTIVIAYFWFKERLNVVQGIGIFIAVAAFAAYRYEGKAAIVTTLAAAVQPLVTVVLALIFLGERIGLIEGLGIGLAIGGAAALSQETRKPATPEG